MFGIMLQKMWHKKWMNICLLLGCILLIATVVSFPIYRSAAYDRMLNDEFKNYITNEGKYPTLIKASATSKKDKTGGTFKSMENFPESFYNEVGVEEKCTFVMYNLLSVTMSSEMKRADAKELAVKLATIKDMDKYSNIIAGEPISESGLNENGAIEVLVSQDCLVSKGLLVGETFQFDRLYLPDGSPIRVYIKGVFDKDEAEPYFWQTTSDTFLDCVFMNTDLFNQYFSTDTSGKYSINLNYTAMFDYEKISADQVADIIDRTKYFTEEGSYKRVVKSPEYLNVFDDYNRKLSRISATLLILQVPVLVMLAAFLFMISGQMYEMEKNEISVIKSRGSSGFQIIKLYIYQGLVITISGAVLGLPLGALFARMLGSTRNFLEFDFSQTLDVAYTKETFIYGLAAVLICLMSIAIPSLKHSRVTIVNLKQSKALRKKALWEKLYIDVILLGVSLYGFYSFNKNMSTLSTSVLAGESLDPLLYVSSSLFIVGAGLLFLRLQPHIVKLIYLVGKKKWGPAAYVSFMENIKNGRKQQLIMLFLIMTISLGMFHATVARTILDNAIENTEYIDGTDIILKEKWTEITNEYGASTGQYISPDYAKYNSMAFAEKFTRVIDDKTGYFTSGKNEKTVATVMGIHTKDFGSITMVESDILAKHYYEYLNELAVVEDGLLVSRNFETKQGMKIGDTLSFYTSKGNHVSGKIVDFVDYFPGYIPSENEVNPDGTASTKDNYLVVAHFDYLTKKLGTYPYEVWVKAKADTTANDVYKWVEENKVSVTRYVNSQSDVQSTMEDPLLQGTNGVLTMGFVVTILLCGVGYLIYWIMSIRERELVFGVLRATGFHKSEIFHVLLNEQIFSGVFSVFAGIGIGKLTSKLFVPILQQAYASENQALPMKLITVASDLYRLYAVIGAVMVIVLVVLVVLLFKMNVTKALKMGEE